MKKIAIIENGWGKFINYAWTIGIKEYIQENHIEAEIYIFNSFGNFSLDEKFNAGEYNIANLPNLSDYDGIILELSNIGDLEIKQSIINRALASKVPTISLVEDIPELYYAGIDNYKAMEKMVEHLVVKHRCNQVNYVGGPIGNSENMARFQAYKDVLERNGIPFDEKRVFHMNYEIMTGERAFEHFYANELLPQAFVCANDNIAVGICQQAGKRGFKIPNDFLITGFDNFDKASYYSPRISTIGFRREDISYAAMRMLHKIWNNEQKERAVYIDTQVVFQDSCGCVPDSVKDRGQYINDRIMAEDEHTRLQTKLKELKRELINSNSFQEMAACLPRSLSVLGYDELYILLNSDLCNIVEQKEEPEYHIDGYPENMTVLLAAMHDCILGGLKRKPGQLVPGMQEAKSGNLYLFSPLHFREREIGYTVIKNCDHLMDSQMLYEVLNVFLETMENMYHRMVLARMNDKLSKLYVHDSLTGIYNRMAYTELAEPAYKRCMEKGIPMSIMFVDMDRLKYINDTFGHDMGNEAIKAIADAIIEVCPQQSIAMRYGGDEFVILIEECRGQRAEEISKKLGASISKKSEELHAQFEISASIGYAVAKDRTKNLNDYIDLADERMYENKKARKMQRNS